MPKTTTTTATKSKARSNAEGKPPVGTKKKTKKAAKSNVATFDRSAAAKRAWETIRANKLAAAKTAKAA